MQVFWVSISVVSLVSAVINSNTTDRVALKCFVGRAGELPHMENCTDNLVNQTLKSMPLANYSYKFKKNMGEFSCINLDVVSLQAEPKAKRNYLGCAHADYDPCKWQMQTSLIESSCHTCMTNLCNDGRILTASYLVVSIICVTTGAVLKLN